MCSTRSTLFLSSLCIGLTAVILAGCGGGSSPGTSRVTVLLSSSSGGSTRTPVPDGDVVSLILTITKIDFQRCDGGPLDDGIWTVDVNTDHFDPTSVTIRPGGLVQWFWTADGEHTITAGDSGVPDLVNPFEGTGSMEGDFFELIFDGADGDSFPYFSNNETDIAAGMAGFVVLDDNAIDDDDNGTGGHFTVFEGMQDFDVVDPSGLSEILSSADIPSGRYCKIRLYVEDPRLLLVEDEPFDPEDPPYRTNVQLTANGRLFIGRHFVLEPGGETLIEIIFEGLHLVEPGTSGKYVLTPQMRAEVDVIAADIQQAVTFVSVDCETDTLVVETEEMLELTVLLSEATTIKDSNETALTCVDLEALAVGDPMEITGLLTLGGMVEAETVVVIVDPI